LGARPETARTIGNGIDLQRFSPMDQRAAREALRIPLDVPVLLAVGALIPRKGFHQLIPAAARVAPRPARLRLYIIGEGNERPRLESLIAQAGMQDRIFLVGPKPNTELRQWYSAADVSCLTSSHEGWANVILESLACGRPVVATNVWGAPEV